MSPLAGDEIDYVLNDSGAKPQLDHMLDHVLSGLTVTPVPLFVGSAQWDPPPFSEQATLLVDTLCRLSHCPAHAVFSGHNHMSQPFSLNSDDQTVGEALLRFMQQSSGLSPVSR